MLNDWRTKSIIIFFSGLIVLFIVAPLLGILLKTSAEEYTRTLQDTEVAYSIRITLLSSFMATLLFGVLSVPLAWLLARKNFPLKGLINGIIDLPVVIPHSAAGIALLGIISRGSFIGQAGEYAGINFVGGLPGIVVAMAFVSIPFAINAARDGFAAVPQKLEKAALNLGAGPIQVFFTISLPLAKRSVISGLIMMWARGLSEFGAVIIIAYHPMVTPILIWERFASFGLSWARPVAAVFIIICLAVFIFMRMVSQKDFHVRN
jgi:molybdate/tungstate transport system permease protein